VVFDSARRLRACTAEQLEHYGFNAAESVSDRIGVTGNY